jgi:glycosyltransferase involved in cell wall biosynthesis
MKLDSIAIVSPRFPDGATAGGAETLLRKLAERLAAAGSRVTFLATCAKDHTTWRNELPPGPRQFGAIEVIRFPVDETRDVDLFHRIQTAISRSSGVPPEDERTWLANSVQSPELCAHLAADPHRYDCILAGPYLFGVVDSASRVAPDRTVLVPCLHDESFAYLGVTGELFRRVRGFLFNSGPEQELASRLHNTGTKPSGVVGMGLEPFSVDPKAFARKRGLTQPYVLYSGRREDGKGTGLLMEYVDTFRKRTGRDVTLVLTGSGVVTPPASLAPCLLDAGFVSEAEKHEAMAGATAFIHPSTFESFGIVLLESFLAGTPALVHSGSEVLRWQCQRSGGGLWFRNYPEFEEELALLLDRTDIRDTMGRQGHNYVVREYSWEVVDQRLLRTLREM